MAHVQIAQPATSHFAATTLTGAALLIAIALTAASSAAQERIPSRARDVQLHGVISPRNRQIHAELRAFVATPFGRIPVTGRGTLSYTCSGRFAGALDYNTVIKVLAHLKGIDLVRNVEGQFSFRRQPPCDSGPDIALRGYAVTDSLNVRGTVQLVSDSIAFAGALWFDGDAHHGIVASVGRDNRLDLRFTMRGPSRPQPVASAAAEGVIRSQAKR